MAFFKVIIALLFIGIMIIVTAIAGTIILKVREDDKEDNNITNE
jgi:hypothetical protein